MKKRPFTVGSLKPNTVSSAPLNPSPSPIPKAHPIPKLPNPSKPKILFSQSKSSFSVDPQRNRTLLDAALEQGQNVEYKCTKGSCGRCTVRISNGQALLSRPNEKEKEKLKQAVGEGYRLACQAIIL
ncbi:2Fe-2S iron-sulfur cluster-binding protein [Ammoniphilus sp. YIM 78166]|uniref:2Fe-2S iron-sulfur cluster-binding protein n=1 Tax=Ammoniphilus sp. YIM 78166 TaxID=1644106 RepID=UPI00106F9EBA|nr:2Fe-2S iron-sulfur cluster-binding protein [Ammoniphilus sp. YIM 78166]